MRKFVCLLLAAAGSAWVLRADAPNPSFRIDTVAGGDDLGDGGPSLSAEFGAIQGIALGQDGTLYLSDTDHHRVRMVKPNGITTTLAGTGTAGFSEIGRASCRERG